MKWTSRGQQAQQLHALSQAGRVKALGTERLQAQLKKAAEDRATLAAVTARLKGTDKRTPYSSGKWFAEALDKALSVNFQRYAAAAKAGHDDQLDAIKWGFDLAAPGKDRSAAVAIRGMRAHAIILDDVLAR